MSLNIPKKFSDAIRAIAELSNEQAKQIGDKLVELELTPPGSVDILLNLVNSDAEYQIDRDALSLLLSLHSAVLETENLSVDRLASDLGTRAKDDQIIEESSVENFVSNLPHLMRHDSCVRVLAKALLLSNKYSNLFDSAEIITDMRPVFVRKAGGSHPSIIKHIVKLSYWRNEKKEDVSLAFDVSELRELVDHIEKSLVHHETLSGNARGGTNSVIELESYFKI